MVEKLTGLKARNYLVEWSGYTSIKSVGRNEENLFFEAKNKKGDRVKIKANREAIGNSKDRDVWERPIDVEETWDVWQWVDAIPMGDDAK